MLMLVVASGAVFTACGDDDDSPIDGKDTYNLINSHWFGYTRINTGDGLLLEDYANQYTLDFYADGTCLMEGSDHSSKTYKWHYPKSAEDKAYLPNGGVIIQELTMGWVWLGTFDNKNEMTLRSALHGDMVKVNMSRED